MLDTLPAGAGVLVVRLRSLGDCVLTTPALAILKAYRPDIRLGVLVEPRFAEVFAGSPDITAVLAPEPLLARRFGPTLTINFHGGTRSAVLTGASAAPVRAGFVHYRFSQVYNLRIPRAQEILGEERPVHTAEHLASAMFHLGVPRCEIPQAKLWSPPLAPPVPTPYAVFHPFASQPDKTWPPERFIEVARHVENNQGITPVFLGGDEDDFRPFAAWRCWSGKPLTEIKKLVRSACLFVGNDSGPAHMAAAFGVPVVALFGSSNPLVWRPWRTPSEVLTSDDGIGAIEAERVLEALGRLRVVA
ncbi:MAG: glycosyltransferase family 9 protein [Bryobacterales bacterium]|nr:glycosyltransferase family 9 protein [Bryobacterales bacterium]